MSPLDFLISSGQNLVLSCESQVGARSYMQILGGIKLACVLGCCRAGQWSGELEERSPHGKALAYREEPQDLDLNFGATALGREDVGDVQVPSAHP